MKFYSVFTLSVLAMASFSVSATQPVLNGTYTTTCLWMKNSEDMALTTAQKVTLTFSGNSVQTQTTCYSDSFCTQIKECYQDHENTDQVSTFKIGKVIPDMYPNNQVYKLTMHDQDNGYGYSCFYLDQKGLADKEVLHLGKVSAKSNAPCEFDDSSNFIFAK